MKIAQKSLKLTRFLQQLKLTDANMLFYDVPLLKSLKK